VVFLLLLLSLFRAAIASIQLSLSNAETGILISMNDMTIDTSMDLKAKHDELLASKPEGVDHDAGNCPYCDSSEEGGDMSKTYTEDEVKAAVEEAIAPLQAELDAIRASQAEEQISARIAEAVAEKDAEISELRGTIDTLTLRAEKAENDYNEVIAWLEVEKKAIEEAAELAARKEERLAVIKEVASFKEEYIEANIDRWVALEEAAFASLVEDWKALEASRPSVATEAKDDDEIDDVPVATAMEASRDNEGGDKWSDMRELSRIHLRGVDLTTL